MATTMAAIAQRAGVNADTVYTAVGAKPALFRSSSKRRSPEKITRCPPRTATMCGTCRPSPTR